MQPPVLSSLLSSSLWRLHFVPDKINPINVRNMNALYSSAFLQLKSKLARSATSICSASKNLFGYSSHLKARKTGSENVKETVTVATTCFECQSVNGVCLCVFVCVGSAPSLIKGSNFTPHPINLYMLVGLFIAVSVTTPTNSTVACSRREPLSAVPFLFPEDLK